MAQALGREAPVHVLTGHQRWPSLLPSRPPRGYPRGARMTAEANVQTHKFKAEVSQVLSLVINSLYSNKDIFLRELVSNAADALDKLRFEAIAKPELMPAGHEPRIRLIPDRAARTLTIWDNGIGMSEQTLAENLGTVARSGTREFAKKLEQAKDKDALADRPVRRRLLQRLSGRRPDRGREPRGGQRAGVSLELGGQRHLLDRAGRRARRSAPRSCCTSRPSQEAYLDEWKLRDLVSPVLRLHQPQDRAAGHARAREGERAHDASR